MVRHYSAHLTYHLRDQLSLRGTSERKDEHQRGHRILLILVFSPNLKLTASLQCATLFGQFS